MATACVNTQLHMLQRVTDLGVEGLMPLQRLTALYLGCCHRLTDSAAQHIGRSMKVREPPASRRDEFTARALRLIARDLEPA